MNARDPGAPPARSVQMRGASLEVPEPEPGMVRNPRTLMVCSLLALATGMALGSRLAPGPEAVAPHVQLALDDRIEAWAWRPRPAALSADVPASTAIAVDAAQAGTSVADTGLEGARHPRTPRMSRETMARTAR